jgi:hypothetical protein
MLIPAKASATATSTNVVLRSVGVSNRDILSSSLSASTTSIVRIVARRTYDDSAVEG